MKQNETNLVPKSTEKYYCEKCDYICSRYSHLSRHKMTLKHKMKQNETYLVPKSTAKYYCEICNSVFNSRTTLWRHKKKCLLHNDTTKLNICSDVNKELLVNLLLKNGDVMEKMLELMPNMGNITNNNNNNNSNNTNTFNINVFLNEHCKNAMNLTDFIQSLPITNKTYDETIQNGLTNTITNMMVNGLNELDILERPIHCTDTKRKTIYIKESNIWEKDKELNKILNGIKEIALKHRMLINKWQEANDGWNTNENIQTKLTTLIYNVMTDIENNEKETNKIINAIGKKVYIDDELKKDYIYNIKH
jgi:hypothetical protein